MSPTAQTEAADQGSAQSQPVAASKRAVGEAAPSAAFTPMPYFCPACQAIPTAGYCRLSGCPTAPAAPEAEPSAAGEHPGVHNLRTCQRQLDADGCEVGVSRQALVEALAVLDELLAALTAIDALEVMEINPSNYDHELVCELSNNAVQAALIARAAIAKASA